MGRRRYMTKRRIEEKISKQRKASLFMVLAVMITSITLTYKNVDGDINKLMGSVYTARTECEKAGGKWDSKYGCFSKNSYNYQAMNDCTKIGGKWDMKKGCILPKKNYTAVEECKKAGGTYDSKKKVCVLPKKNYTAIEECKKAGGTYDSNKKVCVKKDNNNNNNDNGNNNDNNNNNSGGGNSYTPNTGGGSTNVTPNTAESGATNVSPKLTINSSDVVLYVNKTYQLKVTSNIKNDKITYSSNDKNIVIVGSKGLIKGKKEGQAKITATSSSGATIDVNITVGKKFDIGVNYGPNSKVSINKSNKVILNVTDTRLINVWLFDDKLNGNTIYERDYNKVKKSGAIEVKNLPEKGKTKKFYVKNRDSAKLYSYTTFVIKNNNGKYNRSTGPTIKNVRGIQIGDEKYIAYTVSSSHGLSSIKDGKANGKFDNTYSDLNGVNEQSNIVKLSDMNKSKNNYYYLWIHAADNSSFKNYTRTSVQIKLK